MNRAPAAGSCAETAADVVNNTEQRTAAEAVPARVIVPGVLVPVPSPEEIGGYRCKGWSARLLTALVVASSRIQARRA
jgi:hypothetical protein